MKQDILVGLQHGDEGKGKISSCLANTNNYDCYVRFNGGPNAGHTIIYNNNKLVLHQLPCGILKNKPCLISTDCVVDIDKLKEEIGMLEEIGVKVRDNLYISKMCHIITEESIIEDNTFNTIGTTCSGIGQTYSKRALRTGYRIRVDEYYKLVEPFSFLQNFDKIFFEGAQGFELDINYGDYPYVTSSSCISHAIFRNGGDFLKKTYVYGVCKIYDTYVGSKKFGNESDKDLDKLQKIGEEVGATTGRNRKCNWLNMKKLLFACKINKVSTIYINKCDIIQTLGIYKLYDLDDQLIQFNNYIDMKKYISSILEPYYIVVFSSSRFKI
jgi:adenylosuccinate synthase